MNSDLRAALRDLDAAEGEALEEGFPVPSRMARENALPDGFVREALAELKQQDELAA